MTTVTKVVKVPPVIDPGGRRALVDEVLVPMLVRDALNDLAAENSLVLKLPRVAHSTPTALRGAEEMG